MTDVGEKPSILCKFGCGQQVSFEYRNFSDGYSYVLYRNCDDNIPHDCPEIPHHQLNWTPNSDEVILELQKLGMDIKNEVNNSAFKKLFWMNKEFHNKKRTISFLEFQNKESENKELKRELEATKGMCNILPIPFFKLFQSRKTNTTYLLTKLAENYQKIGDYENAIIALTIQNEITHDQADRIIEVQNIIAKKSNMPQLDPVQDILERMYSNFSNKLEQEKEYKKIKDEKINYLKQKEEDIKKMEWKKFGVEVDDLLGRVNKDQDWSNKIFEFNQKNKTVKSAKKINELIKTFEGRWKNIPKEFRDWKIEDKKDLENVEKNIKNNQESLNQNSMKVKSVDEIREKIRKVERMLKSFVVKSFNDDPNQFRNAFPEIWRDAEREREKSKKDTLHLQEKDIIDYITLGTIIVIIVEKNNSKYFPKWNYYYNTNLHTIRSFRNNYDHSTEDNIEESIIKQDKMLVDIYCDQILEHLVQIGNK